MTERLQSGDPHLDEILGGGLPVNAINLVVGQPGSGKTTLAEQYVFGNATRERPAVYLTTASEPLEKLLRYGERMAFFRAEEIGQSVFYEDLGPILQRGGLGAALDRLVSVLRDRRPGFLVIDSFKAFQIYAADPLEFRRFVIELAGRLSAVPTTAFWVGEYDVADISTDPEFAVADSILALGSVRNGDRTARAIQVLKLRGSDFRSGSHAYRLSADGVRVFPRLADPPNLATYSLTEERQSIGIADLDRMLGGGLWPGSATLVAGPSGSGKTLTGLHFLREGAVRSEPGIYASLQENATQVERVMRGYGWSLTGAGFELMYSSPVDVYIDEWVYTLLDRITETGATRVVIDSLSDLRIASPDPIRFHEYIYSLVQRCSRLNVTLLMTHEVRELFGVIGMLDSEISHLSDNVIVLRYEIADRDVVRSALVLKTRASYHDPTIRRFAITEEGIGFDLDEVG